MTRRLALVVANDRYSDPALSELFAPRRDAERLLDLLRDPEIGGFEPADILVNQSKSEVEKAIERLFLGAGPGDLVALYFSGHGVRSRRGRLRLAVSNTELDMLAATAIPASFLIELIQASDAASTVVLLDCCYSGAFAGPDGLKSDPSADVGEQLSAGRGVYVLTASTAIERAQDGTPATPNMPRTLSAFTDAVVRGIASGAADMRGTGVITPSDLWEYVRRELPRHTTQQTPTQYGYVEDEVHLARVRPGYVPGSTPEVRIHLADLLGRVSETEESGLRAEDWWGNGRLVVPIGQVVRGADRAQHVLLDLAHADGNLLIVGRAGGGKSTLLRTLISSLALTHRRDDVRFYCLESGGNRLGSLQRIPHFARLSGDDEADNTKDLLDEILSVIRARKQLFRKHEIDASATFRGLRHQLPDGPHPDVFLFIDRWAEFAATGREFVDAVRSIASVGPEYGVHTVVTARRWQDVPDDLHEILQSHLELRLADPAESRIDVHLARQLPADRSGWALHRGQRFRVALPNLQTVGGSTQGEIIQEIGDGGAELVERIAKSWENIPGGGAIVIPSSIQPFGGNTTIADLLGLGDIHSLDVERAWSRRSNRETLRVPFGVTRDGKPVELDLKEPAQDGMGPHGLLIGATGSGKSELLRTLVLALAATHSSEILNFILVDFKGGATFTSLDKLPHVAAVITNLADELPLVDRMVDAINGELVRRQELLRRAGNFASLRDYEKARAGGAPLAPLPSLLIICDEFSELLTAKPDFIDLFVQIGRIGRSLGVHLLLASQRLEEGRLRGLETHLSYRIGLRTFSTLESRTVLGVPDAYELPHSPGHGYLKYGAEPMVRFKVAASFHVPATDGLAADSTPLAEQLTERLAGKGLPAHQVWLPPLTNPPSLDELVGPVAVDATRGLSVSNPQLHGALQVPVALVDKPYEQRRDLLWLQLDGAAGHVAVVGAPQSGKSTSLRTLITGLALTHTPAEAQVYCLDFGGGQLAGLRELPHVGGVAGRLDTAAVRRTVGEVATLLADRERRFAATGVDSMAAYRRRRATAPSGGAADDPFGDVFLVVDGWGTLRSEYDDLEALVTDIATRGLSYGIHVVAAASRWLDFRPAIRDLFGSRLELRLGDPSDSSVSRRAATNVPERSPGRGITAEQLHFLTAVPKLTAGEPADLVKQIAAGWSGAPAPRVRMLPAVVPFSAIANVRDEHEPLSLPIGIAEADLRPVLVDFASEPHFLLFGDTESGKTTFLRSLAATITSRFTPEQARLVVVDYRRSLLGAVQTEHLIGYGTGADHTQELTRSIASYMENRLPPADVTAEQMRTRSWWTGPECFVLVDDYDLVTSGPSNPLLPLLDYLAQARDVGLHLIMARRSGGASRAMFEPVIQRLRELSSPGLILSSDRDEGPLLGNVRPSAQPPGCGWLVTRKEGVRLIQVANMPSGYQQPLVNNASMPHFGAEEEG